jgi:hypothetical protein
MAIEEVVIDLKKETTADVLPSLLMLAFIIEIIIKVPGIVIAATWFGIVILLCIWGWVRGTDGNFTFWTLITAGFVGLIGYIAVMISRAKSSS